MREILFLNGLKSHAHNIETFSIAMFLQNPAMIFANPKRPRTPRKKDIERPEYEAYDQGSIRSGDAAYASPPGF